MFTKEIMYTSKTIVHITENNALTVLMAENNVHTIEIIYR